MSFLLHNEKAKLKQNRSKHLRLLLCSAAILGAAVAPGSAADDAPKGSFRILTFNTWGERFSGNIANMSDFFKAGDYDIIGLQELAHRGYVSQLPGMLKDQGLGDYKALEAAQDSGIITRLEGTLGSSTAGLGKGGNGGVAMAYLNAQQGLPKMTVGVTHLDWRDESDDRREQAKELIALADSLNNPFIITGDFNAGDVSERGLERSLQQALLYTHLFYDNAPSALWQQLGKEYAPDGKVEETQSYIAAMRATDPNGQQHYRNVLQTYFDAHRDEFPGVSSIGDMSWQQWAYIVEKDMASNGLVLEDEMYPVESNTPVTLNVLKKKYILLQNEGARETFEPLTAGDGISTWTSSGEDDTNTWASWDHAQIDHFMASRPYGKWYVLADDPNDPYSGVMDEVSVGNDGTPLSDHNTVGHTIRWVGPVLEDFAGDETKKTVVWGADASTFGEEKTVYVAGDGQTETLDGNTFYLTRNNARTDVRLGQIADEDGNPILDWLSEDEKKQMLDCYSTDGRLQSAIAEYCIDNHAFIGETLVRDGGIVIVDEDAALGSSDADLRLNNGTLKIAGTAMTRLSRNVVLEGEGGTFDIAKAENLVTVPGTISGTGALTKAGAGALNLTGENSYTGTTEVTDGALFVNGSIAASSLTTVYEGALLGGNGTLGSLRIAAGGTLSPGNSIGMLTVDGDITFDQGSNYTVEIDANGNVDQVIATGAATINGGTMATVAANGNYQADTSYTVLTAAGGVSGSFDEVTTNLAFLTPFFASQGSALTLDVIRNDLDFSAVATTANGRATANAIESVGPGTMYNAIIGLDAGTAASAFNQLSGGLYPSLTGAMAEDSHFFRDAVSARFIGGSDTAIPAGDAADRDAFSVWAHAYGAHGSLDGNDVGRLDRNSGGFYFGGDARISESFTLGAMAGYGHSAFDLDNQAASANADTYLIGAYGAAWFDALRITVGGAYAFDDIDAKRAINFGTFSDNLTSDFDGSTSQIFVEAAYGLDFAGGIFEPYLGLAQVHAETDSFTETGGPAALSTGDSDMNVTYMDLGLRASKTFTMGERTASVNGQIGWRHAFGDITPDTAMAIAGSAPFTIDGTPINENAAIVNAGLNFNLADNANLYVNYVGQFADGGSENGVNAGLEIRF